MLIFKPLLKPKKEQARYPIKGVPDRTRISDLAFLRLSQRLFLKDRKCAVNNEARNGWRIKGHIYFDDANGAGQFTRSAMMAFQAHKILGSCDKKQIFGLSGR